MAKRTENIRFPLDPQLGRPYSRQGNSAVIMHIFTNARKQDPGSEFFHPGSKGSGSRIRICIKEFRVFLALKTVSTLLAK
jgi:hypothetical protein